MLTFRSFFDIIKVISGNDKDGIKYMILKRTAYLVQERENQFYMNHFVARVMKTFCLVSRV